MDHTRDQFFLKETLKLAKKGMGWTNPNPMVGALIVKRGKIIGQGYHKKVGLSHAEIEALKSVKGSTQGATLYINLEPCSHFGRTPPCVDEIIKAKISRVVYSTLDPNPKVNGKGVAKLKKTGIDVSIGILEDQARLLNEAYFTFHEKNRPFIALKFASSLDGKIATKTGDSKWITNEKTMKFARSLRGQYQAVLVGINTVLRDNPHLGVRDKTKKDPLRIVLDANLKIPLESQVLRDNNVLIVTSYMASNKKIRLLKEKGVTILAVKNKNTLLEGLLNYLSDQEVISILVEGGGKTLGSFADKKLVDKVYAFYAPIIIGGEKAVSSVTGEGIKNLKEAIQLKNISYKYFQDNYLVSGYQQIDS